VAAAPWQLHHERSFRTNVTHPLKHPTSYEPVHKFKRKFGSTAAFNTDSSVCVPNAYLSALCHHCIYMPTVSLSWRPRHMWNDHYGEVASVFLRACLLVQRPTLRRVLLAVPMCVCEESGCFAFLCCCARCPACYCDALMATSSMLQYSIQYAACSVLTCVAY
jgi:hypothetical protein